MKKGPWLLTRPKYSQGYSVFVVKEQEDNLPKLSEDLAAVGKGGSASVA